MGTLSYILLYRHNNKDCQDYKLSRCPRDPDSPSLSTSVLSSLTSLEPRRERSSPDPRLSSASGLTSRARSSRTPRTSILHPRRQDDPHLRKGQGPCLRYGQVPQDSPDRLNYLTQNVRKKSEVSGNQQTYQSC